MSSRLCVSLFTALLLSLLLWHLTAQRAFAEGAVSLSGFLELRYDGRYLSDGKGEDNKLHQVVDMTMKENRWGHFRFSLAGDLTEDLDGKEDDDQIDRTITIRDTWDSSTVGFLYVCQAELYDLGRIDYARFGRQYVRYELTTTHLDGFNCMGKLDLFNKRIKPFVYGGIPVRLYEEGQYLDATEVGGGTHIFLSPWTRITAEYQFIEEEPDIVGTYGESGESRYEQSAVALRRELLHKGYGYISLYWLDHRAKHVDSMFSILFDKVDLAIDASYFYQFDVIDDMPTTISPYIGLMGPIKPHHKATLDMTKGVYKDCVWLSGGTEWRILDSGEEESAFNHSYNHHYLALITEDLLMKGIGFSVQANYWQVLDDNNDDSILTFTGGIRYEKPRSIRLSVGSSYSLFSYDYFADPDEKTDVYTVHPEIRYYVHPNLYLDARYELDIYDIYEHRFIATVGLEI